MAKMDARTAANNIVRWFFEEMATDFDASRIPLAKRAGREPKLSEGLWARLLVDAISSFSKGLEDVESDGKRASITHRDYDKVLNFVGDEALGTIAFLVVSAQVRRPLDQVLQKLTGMFMQAQQIFQGAVSRKNDQQALFQAKNQINGLIQQAQQLGPEVNEPQAKDILNELATMRTQLEQHENQALSAPLSTMTAPSKQQVGTLPSGVHIGRKARRAR